MGGILHGATVPGCQGATGVPQCGVPQCGVPQCGVPQCGVPQCGVPQCGGGTVRWRKPTVPRRRS